jgi:hypothetical protein
MYAPPNRVRALPLLLVLGAAICLAAAALHAQPGTAGGPTERCERLAAARSDAATLIERSVAAAGMRALAGDRLHARYADAIAHRYESDRMYAPSLTYVHSGELWADPAAGTQRTDEQMLGGGGTYRTPALVTTTTATFAARGDTLFPVPQLHAFSGTQRRRAMDPWSVLAEWRDAAPVTVRAAERCLYRDRWRIVVTRAAAPNGFTVGDERIYLDAGSGLVVKLDRRERDGLWGAVHAEYVYTNWDIVGTRGAPNATPATDRGTMRYPLAVARLEDGAVDIARSIAGVDVTTAAAGPSLTLPAASASVAMASWRPAVDTPDTVRVGPQAFVLQARGYSSMIALAHDTVYVIDATGGDERARLDSTWVARLFAGAHPVRVIVTDLAWPHISGVRFWVARGATIVSHRDSRAFLASVVDRRWTDAPDALETLRTKHPNAARLRFVAVGDSLSVAGGLIRLLAIDGFGSEGALMAYLTTDHFLWAGDYVQKARVPTAYAREVIAAVMRNGVAPDRLAAMHLPVTPWSTVVAAQGPTSVGAAGTP